MSVTSYLTGKFKKGGSGGKTSNAPKSGLLDYPETRSSTVKSQPTTKSLSKPSSGGSISKYLQTKNNGGKTGGQTKDDKQLNGFLAELAKLGYNIYKPEVQRLAREALDVSSSQGSAAVNAGLAGFESLAMSYMKEGKITPEAAKKAAVSSGLTYAGEGLMQSNFYKGSSIGGQAAMSGGYAGLASAAAQYADKGEVDWGKAGIAAGKAGFQNYVENSMAANNVSPGAGAAAGAGLGSISSTMQKRWEGEEIRAEQEAGQMGGSMIGAAAGSYFGGVGAAAGGLIGGLAGRYGMMEAVTSEAEHDRHMRVLADQNKGAIYWDGNKFVPNKVVAVDRYKYWNVGGNSASHIPNPFPTQEEHDKWVNKGNEDLQKFANEWNNAVTNYDKLDRDTKFQVDALLAGDYSTALEYGKLRLPGWDEKNYIDMGDGKRIHLQGVDWEYGANDVRAQTGLGPERYGKEFGSDEGFGAVNPATGKYELGYGMSKETSRDIDFNRLDYAKKAGRELSSAEQEFYDDFKSGGHVKREQEFNAQLEGLQAKYGLSAEKMNVFKMSNEYQGFKGGTLTAEDAYQRYINPDSWMPASQPREKIVDPYDKYNSSIGSGISANGVVNSDSDIQQGLINSQSYAPGWNPSSGQPVQVTGYSDTQKMAAPGGQGLLDQGWTTPVAGNGQTPLKTVGYSDTEKMAKPGGAMPVTGYSDTPKTAVPGQQPGAAPGGVARYIQNNFISETT